MPTFAVKPESLTLAADRGPEAGLGAELQPEQVYVLDLQGAIRASSAARPMFGDAPAAPVNLLDLCDHVTGEQAPVAAAVAAGLRQVLTGRHERFALTYSLRIAGDERWFEARASLAAGVMPSCVVHHLDVTARHRAGQQLLQLEATLQATSGAIVVLHGTRGTVLHVNAAACAMFGRTQSQLLSCSRWDLFLDSGAEASDRQLAAGAADGAAIATKVRHADGHWVPVEVQTRCARVDGVPLVIKTARDITLRRSTEVALQRQSQRHEMLASFGQFALENPPHDELMAEAAAIVGRGLHAALCRLLQATADDAVLRQVAGSGWDADWLSDPHFDAVVETVDHFALGARESIVVTDFHTELRFAPSPILQAHQVRSAVEALICGAGGSYGVLGAYAREPGRFDAADANFVQSIANTLAAAVERRQAEERLAHMAQFDALTSLPNRGLYLDRLGQSLIEAERDRRAVGVLFVDIDRFKHVNDSLGHAVGDQLLIGIAERLKATVRPGDTVGRLGGDEFTVTLTHLARDDDAATVTQKIVTALAAPYRIGGHNVYVSASVGISIYPFDGGEPDTLLKNADTAMYRAKEAGRNGYEFYLPQMNERAVARMRIESDLRGALGRNELLLHYQPKVDLRTGAISGMEALLRWAPPGRDLVSPADFVPVLEETGLIVPVGEWVVATVCRQIRAWQAQGIAPPPVAVNLSARQFGQSDLDAVIGGILADSGVAPGLLELELTESTLMSDSEAAVQALLNMKARGIRISVDDFGTGYSSLSYLKRFPLDALKIDRAFIRDVSTDSDDATIAKAIISLAHSLKLKVVGEGVEDEQQLDFLRRNGCDEMQGFYFARPLTADAMTAALREDRRLVLAPLTPLKP